MNYTARLIDRRIGGYDAGRNAGKILRNIAKNGKLSTEDLAAMLAASPEEIEKEMNAMEEQGIICGYPTLINWDKTGCEHVTALIEVTVAPERGRGFDKVAERIYQFDEVESLYLMSGSGFDLTVIIVGKTMKEVAWLSRRNWHRWNRL